MHLTQLPPYPVPLCVSAWVLIAASMDIVSRRIPNWLVGSGLVIALAVQIWLHGAAAGSVAWLAGAATGFVALLPFYLLRGMAAGDVKLMAMVGAWLGASTTCEVVLVTFIVGGIGSVLLVAGRGHLVRLLRNVRALTLRQLAPRGTPVPSGQADPQSVGSIPYGVAIAAGTLGVLYGMAG
ncbi:A24 family peptidase [Paraburkholderia dinghuensis]|uniref:Peptidase A24 n=1 Tax=Paraburkholderia dinghuensis TaxID=2305225 RepID=A0A3N6Q0F8_9BURK|nr:prepilin peptidase [Paraburkholderia dinghuensis]RQH08380.1 peptidase A24 [Paraburkholderia dinghuensis]